MPTLDEADMEGVGEGGKTPLHAAAECGSVEAVLK